MKARDSVLREAYEDTEKKLSDLTSDTSAYSQLVSDLILQGVLLLQDSEVVVRCRRADVEIVDSCLEAVAEKYLAKISSPVKLTTDKATFLSDACSGGVVLSSQGGTITVDNTFEGRLDIAYNQNLPEIRKLMFSQA